MLKYLRDMTIVLSRMQKIMKYSNKSLITI